MSGRVVFSFPSPDRSVTRLVAPDDPSPTLTNGRTYRLERETMNGMVQVVGVLTKPQLMALSMALNLELLK